METLDRLMALSHPTAVKARKSFDKQALLEMHDLTRQEMEATEASQVSALQSHLSLMELAGSNRTASSIPLERLTSISLTQLQVEKTHQGRVLYGTLCAEAYWILGIFTVLEDDNGLAVWLGIYNVPHYSQTHIERLYPKGAKVAIREPYYMYGLDDSPVVCVYSENVEMVVTENEKRAEEERKKGNSYFREKQWDAAAKHYTNCIDAALLVVENGSSYENNNMKNLLLHAYSNRAETRLQVNKYELALEDSDKALGIDSGNLMALYRKGRALIGLSRYETACECLEKADKATPGQKKIQDLLLEAKTLYSQSPNVQNDISDFLLGFGPPPEIDDFIGPVEIKMIEDGRGRGLCATREIFMGQLFLVCNAIAVTYEHGQSPCHTGLNVNNWGNINMASQKHLVAAVVCAAKKSQILLRQLYTLDDSSVPGNLDVPAIDLFKGDGQMSGSQENEKLPVDFNRIRAIISRNSFSGTESSKSKMYEAKLIERGQNFSGLWLLPSFINHSCLPNSSMLKVGSAMFIHASKPINSGEEITISYFDTLVPLPQRQAMCEKWGFECKCRRCLLELSLKAALEPINTRFQELHDITLEEICTATPQERIDAYLPACTGFSKLFVETEYIIRNSALLKAQEENNWIRSSFVSAYLVGIELNNFLTMTLPDCVPSPQEVMDAVQDTVPGDIRALIIIVAKQLEEAKHLMGDESGKFIPLYASGREACIRAFGKHSEGVLKSLVLRYLNSHFF